ncbi:MAG: DUF2161 domain-containing phosphodiesterase [Paracoccaceae bacterium]|uniref:DUF2161 domain-containing phosphodiesterase n=1 Tax=Seohaeicola saemankumensis TaxID=481181 RepID=UPI001E37F271|nr:DUF2161 family putative PD-(D/E)XK-type phosphodiesterase [Seohaeicola saemankumensis]MCD1626095.1 hypothetical protein [Seohaeicola saemankumensis]
MQESDLYAPVKAFLEAQGYTVKGEVGAVDVLACRGADDPVVVELKTGFSLALLHQAIARQAVTDVVYVAVPYRKGKVAARAMAANVGLCRRLGLGVLSVRESDGLVVAHADPGPFRPRKQRKRKATLLREFQRLEGDPNRGGSVRQGLMTGYRQDALRCAAALAQDGPSRGRDVAAATGVTVATRIMADNHYGWFVRVATGVYALTEQGQDALR